MTSNYSVAVEADSTFQYDWIELYNEGEQEVDLTNHSLATQLENSQEWIFPSNTIIQAKDYLIVWADRKDFALHSNFKLNSNNGLLLFIDEKGSIQDSIRYPQQFANISYGRKLKVNVEVKVVGEEWFFFEEPTPGAANQSKAVQEKLSQPIFEREGGFYDNDFFKEAGLPIKIKASIPDAQILYTLDGSDPRKKGQTYSEAIVLDSIATAVVVRAVAQHPDFLTSDCATHTFFSDELRRTIPVVALSIDPDDAWSDSLGILVEGTQGIERYGKKANYWQKWERPAHMEYFENSLPAVSAPIGIRVFGNSTRLQAQKSLAIFFREKYGAAGVINYPFFGEQRSQNSYHSLVLRNSGNDWNQTMFRDVLMYELANRMGNIDGQAYQPVEVYINGEYYGILNLREKINVPNLAIQHKLAEDSIDYYPSRVTISDSIPPKYHYRSLFSFFHQSIRSSEMTKVLEKEIDLSSFFNFCIAQQYFNNVDSHSNKSKLWRPKNGLWRWLLYDTDCGFALRFEGAQNHELTAQDPLKFYYPLDQVLRVDSLEKHYLQLFAHYLNTDLQSDSVEKIINEKGYDLKEVMDRHVERWSGSGGIASREEWRAEIERVIDFARQRPEFLRKDLIHQFELDGEVTLKIKNPNNEQPIYLNGQIIQEFPYSGQFFKNIPLTLKVNGEEVDLEMKKNTIYKIE